MIEIEFTGDEGFTIASCPSPTGQRNRMWFTSVFLMTNPVKITTPTWIWTRDDDKITQNHRTDPGKYRVWILTDEYDHRGYRLGVWPD